MAHYRLYDLDHDGRICKAVDLDCADDSEAIGAAQGLRPAPAAFELWSGRRVVQSAATGRERAAGCPAPA